MTTSVSPACRRSSARASWRTCAALWASKVVAYALSAVAALVRERVDSIPQSGPTIIATGPLTAPGLAGSIAEVTGADALAFFDAIAPIVHRDSIDMDICWMAARWDKGGKDYINCPMNREQYLAFHAGLIAGVGAGSWSAAVAVVMARTSRICIRTRGEATTASLVGRQQGWRLRRPSRSQCCCPAGRDSRG